MINKTPKNTSTTPWLDFIILFALNISLMISFDFSIFLSFIVFIFTASLVQTAAEYKPATTLFYFLQK